MFLSARTGATFNPVWRSVSSSWSHFLSMRSFSASFSRTIFAESAHLRHVFVDGGRGDSLKDDRRLTVSLSDRRLVFFSARAKSLKKINFFHSYFMQNWIILHKITEKLAFFLTLSGVGLSITEESLYSACSLSVEHRIGLPQTSLICHLKFINFVIISLSVGNSSSIFSLFLILFIMYAWI